MTMEDKEIKFWSKYDLIPPFLEECGMGDWEKIKQDYLSRQEELKKEGIREEKALYDEIIRKITKDDVDKVLEDGLLPDKLLSIIDEDVNDGNFISKKYKVKIGNIYDIVEKDFTNGEIDDTESNE